MNKVRITIFFIGMILVASCDKRGMGYNYNQGNLPDLPVHLSDFNTAYDDYNSTAPSLGDLIPFCFSTNRHSSGKEYDVIYQPMNVNFDKTSGELKVTNKYANWEVLREDFRVIEKGIDKIKTTGNEFGPNLTVGYNSSSELVFTLMYSSDESGHAQIKFITNNTDHNISEPMEVDFLNSEYADMYPTFNADRSMIYFCSDRKDDNFDIYYVKVNPEMDTESLLSGKTAYEVVKDNSLSGIFDDKCPFIFENKMVFASNRAGGFGGYDLYYSNLESGDWSEPINFGDQINTEYDEFRPILLNEGVSNTQTMMVFSSNREGGFGGFDLYFVGIPN